MNTSFKYFITFLLTHLYFLSAAQDMQKVDSLLHLVKSTNNDTTKISALIAITMCFQDYNLDKAFEYGEEAFALSLKLSDPENMGKAHNRLGDLYWYKGDFGKSSEHYFNALKKFEKLNDKAAIAECYRNIGWIYDFQENYNEALNYYLKSLVINQELNRKNNIAINHSDIGIIYTKQEKYKDAIKSYENALNIFEETHNKKGIEAIYNNMSTAYNRMGNLKLAIATIEKSVIIAEKSGNKRYLASCYNSLGEYYTKAKRYRDASLSLEKAVINSNYLKDKNLLKENYDNFSELFEKQSDFKKAFEYSQLAATLKDSIYNENNNMQANEMTAKYESEKKELMIESLEKDKALTEEKLQREKTLKIYLIIFCFMIGAFVFVLLRSNVQKKKANLALSSAYEEIEEKNKDITDSINYSKRIQDASLSPKELKYKLFPDVFVMFKPKDIVSGDYYWYAEKNSKRLIAASDCTGHGVPGALMSMIGNNILNRIVNEKGITSPDEILNQLHNEIRKALNQTGQSGTRDGMDIALITFNSETEIEYAGAQRPLWIVREGKKSILPDEKKQQGDHPEEDYERRFEGATLTEIKPDKYSIGGLQSETERKFTKHTVSLSKGDSIYIFSDGFADQFGGTEGKKFMSKRFKDLLLENYTKLMTEQENITQKTLETWKGNHDQVDDILVIGIKI